MSNTEYNEQRTATRQRLLEAALSAFGQKDFDSVGTRQIAEAAGANIAAISYHFGGKQALYLHTATYLADSLQAGIRPQLERIEAALPDADAAQCRRMLSELVSGFAEILLTGKLGEDAPGFVFREQNHPTEAFKVLYKKCFQPVHQVMVKLLACARGLSVDAPETLMIAHALLGPAIAFRSARTTMLKHLSKRAYSPRDLDRIKHLLSALTAAALDFELDDEARGSQA